MVKKVYCYYKYSDLGEMLDRVFYCKPLSHRKHPSKNLKIGDIVTTKCGFDLGFVAEITPKLRIYSRNFRGEFLGFAEYGAVDFQDWYVIAENISLNEWKNACLSRGAS